MNVREKKDAVPKSLEAWGQRYRSTTDDLAYVCLASAGCPISQEVCKHHAEGGDFTTRATRRNNAERIPDLAKINETG